ncbi:segregation/condensation protein A [Aquihabitans sp. G128]|uniref:segregation and condensation protein A n=1 Tax=Aquihabitans sp. G128 TaxID=2849779 RepID=UPI001C24115B|nr:ScpA family protein [Aquihabitans sp. G128]QXC62018.1 segregation/condensation protein A [Aquihabitans sp. G128]
MAYEVHTTGFEGPFDLLLHLIIGEQVDLYEISLSRIVDAYLAELEKMEHLDLEVATEFLLIAATLVELKTRRLLPEDAEVDLDDEFSLWEERDLLLARLVECKTFKDAALLLSALADDASRSFPRTAGLDERFFDLAPDLLAGVTGDDIAAAFVRAVTPKPVLRVELDHVAPSRLSVTEAVSELVDELPRVGRITFRHLTDAFVERLDVVIRFLAVLEMYKQGLIDLDQPTTFGDLTITWIGGEVDDDDRSVFVDLAGRIDVYEG